MEIAGADLWAAWMTASGKSPRTIAERLRILHAAALHARAHPAEMTWEHLTAWLAALFVSAGTKRAYVAAMHAYYQWLQLTDQRVDDPTMKLAKVRVKKGTPRPVTTDQLELALRSGRFYAHTRTYVLLGAYQGLRVSEIAGMRGDYIRGQSLRVIGKGGTDEILPLHPIIAAEARLYPRVGWWFPRHDDPSIPVLGNSVSHVLSLALKRAGVPATGHQLRHWYGTENLRASGGDLRTVQELMRHASPATTAVYTLVDDSRRREVIEMLPVPLHAIR